MTTVPISQFGTCFDGNLVDTGAAKGSGAGVIQYEAYCKQLVDSPGVDESKAE